MKTKNLITLLLVTIATLTGCDATPLYIGFMRVDGSGGAVSTSTTSTAGGAGGVGGAGGALLCSPGATQPCYSGPAGTEGQGICEAGTQACAADGMSWGACSGEVLPGLENCATAVDEDCDGLAPPCDGSLLWAKRFGDGGDQYGDAITTDTAGNVVIAGHFSGSLDFGGGPLSSAGQADIFVAKLDAAGEHLWSKRFGDGENQAAQALAVDGAGNILLAGYFRGGVDFGGGVLTSAGLQDTFLVKLDPSGAHLWSKRFGDAEDQLPQSLTVDGTGNVTITGYSRGSVDFGGGALVNAGLLDVFVAQFDTDGGHRWSKRFGDAQDQGRLAAAALPSGDVVLTGFLGGAMDFGGGPLTSAGIGDVLLAKLDPSGTHQWSERFGDADNQVARGISADPAGNVFVTGGLSGATTFGGSLLTSAGEDDIFLAKFDAGGEHIWSKRFGDAAIQYGVSVTADASGNSVITGLLFGSADLGGGPLASAGGADVLLAKLDPNGTHIWSKRFGDAEQQYGQAVTTDGAGNVLLTGYFRGSVDFGGGTLASAGGYDLFVAKWKP